MNIENEASDQHVDSSENVRETPVQDGKLPAIVRAALQKTMPSVLDYLSAQIVGNWEIFAIVEREVLAGLKAQASNAALRIYLIDKEPMLSLNFSDCENELEFSLDEISFDLNEEAEWIDGQIACADAFIAKFQDIKAQLQVALIAAHPAKKDLPIPSSSEAPHD